MPAAKSATKPTRTVTFRAPEARIRQLDKIAAQQRRDRSFVLNEAVEGYLAMEAYNREMIEEGLREANAGIGVPHEQVVAEFEEIFARARPNDHTRKRAS